MFLHLFNDRRSFLPEGHNVTPMIKLLNLRLRFYSKRGQHYMYQKISLALSIMLLAVIFRVNAQYDANIHRQSDEEMQRNKKLRLHFATISLSEEGNEVPFGIN